MTRYGFIGLGIMGSAMAANLARAGLDLTVWNRTPGRSAALERLGARVAASAAQVVADTDITFAMLADPAAARAVCEGDDGVLAAMAPGKGYVDMSTVDPTTTLAIGEQVARRGGAFLEAPVSGSRKPAEEGSLIILAAGDRGLYDRALPALERMGKKILFLGEPGNGARMKLAVNMVMGQMMAGLCEGMALASASGLAASDLLEVLDSGALANPMFRLKGGSIQRGDFTTAFPLVHMQKDLRLALALGEQSGQPLFAAASVNELFKRALAMGLGTSDFSAVAAAVDGLRTP
jgi:3-hydroxyisobutyrate dehydrogenase-like beta-hydroxyacid dehydrogenase